MFIFINKMDLTFADRSSIIGKISKQLSDRCVDFSAAGEVFENAAACDEELMEMYLESGEIAEEAMKKAISQRRIFPCFFGSALKLDGVADFMEALVKYTDESHYNDEFGAKVYKISYDSKGTRLTHLKVLGGRLNVRSELSYADSDGNETTCKVSSVRFYSGEKFRTAECAESGMICAVTGLDGTYAGQGIGCVRNSDRAVLEPVMTYRVLIPKEKNIFDALKELRRLEDEDPQLHIVWNEQLHDIHIQLMGAVQLEVLTRIIAEKYGYSVEFDSGAVAYKETIAAISEGVGHYEPLRHYAEVHLLLEPLPQGSGLKFDSICREDDLDRNWQRLILTHLEEKLILER